MVQRFPGAVLRIATSERLAEHRWPTAWGPARSPALGTLPKEHHHHWWGKQRAWCAWPFLPAHIC